MKAQTDQLVAIMKSIGALKEGNVVTLDFVDGATRVGLNGAAKGIDRRRGVQQGADQDLGRRQAGAGRSQEGDAGRLVARHAACPTSGRSCGYRLLTVGGDGRLTLTDDFLRSYLLRPELAPVSRVVRRPSSRCTMRCSRHPRRAVTDGELAAIADDGRARELRHLAALPRAAARRARRSRRAYVGAVPRRRRGRAAAVRRSS